MLHYQWISGTRATAVMGTELTRFRHCASANVQEVGLEEMMPTPVAANRQFSSNAVSRELDRPLVRNAEPAKWLSDAGVFVVLYLLRLLFRRFRSTGLNVVLSEEVQRKADK